MLDTCHNLVGVIVGNQDYFVTAFARVETLPSLMASKILELLLLLLDLDVVGATDVIDVGRPRCSAQTYAGMGGS